MCDGGDFVAAWQLDIDDDCYAEEEIGECTEWISSSGMEGEYFNVTKTLQANSKCTIKIDATEYLARVVFDNTDSLGVLFPGYIIGQPISVETGETKYVTIYNGDEAGPITYRLSFSSAQQMMMSGLSLIIVMVSTLY